METRIGGEPPVLILAGALEEPLRDLASYRAVGGYAQLERARAMTPQQVTEMLIQSNLRGRGGAFFPTGRKASFIPTPEKVAKPIYLTVNADAAYWKTHTGSVSVSISWAAAGNDFNLYLYSGGNQVGTRDDSAGAPNPMGIPHTLVCP